VTTPAPPRVAFVVGLASGGTASHVAALVVGCQHAGLEVSVLGPAPTLALLGQSLLGQSGCDSAAAKTSAAAETSVTLKTYQVDIADRARPGSAVTAVAAMRSAIAAWRPDVVHAHGVRAGALAVLAIAFLGRRSRPALVVTVHNAPPDDRAARLVYGLLERVCARRADLVLCASADLLARMRRLGAADAQQSDVPAAPMRAPSAAEIAKAKADIGAGDRPVLLAVARLAPQKGLDVLIAAAARWRGRDPQPRTVIAGDGPLAAELRAQASQAGADVLLLGARRDVPALLAIADVVIVPSRWEARALIVQEAMQSGRPIIATRVGGIPELTGDDGALLVGPDDAPALAAAVTRMLDDPALAARLSTAASARSASFPVMEDAMRAAVSTYARLAIGRS
jgi:glycosyltransferase involved in cell wall biosynthesis